MSQEGPSPLLVLSIVSVRWLNVVSIKSAMELFRETVERKVCKGKNNNERKQRYEALLNNKTHVRPACCFIVEIQYLFIKAAILLH